MTIPTSPSAFFSDDQVRRDLLRQRAYNLRWACQDANVIPLTAADPDFPVAPEIRAAVAEYAAGGVFSYGPNEGLPEFKETVAAVMQARKHIPCTPGLVLPTDSAASAMFLIARCLLQPGDEAIIFDPVDFLFGKSVEAAGGVKVLTPVDKRTGELDLDDLRRKITPRTRLIGLCNPHNPLGRVLTRAELLAIGQIAIEHDLTIMADEIWSDIVYTPHQHLSIASLDPEIARRTISVFGFSKTFGLAGLRVGFLVAPTPELYACLLETSLAETTATGVATLSQVAAQAAYQHCWYWAEAFVQHLQAARDLAVERLNRIPGMRVRPPQGTYVLFPDVTGLGLTSQQAADYLLREACVAVVPGQARWFGPGAEGNIRLCFSTSLGILTEALDRIESALMRL